MARNMSIKPGRKAAPKARALARRAPLLEELEPRILYSADFAPGLAPDTGLAANAELRILEPSGDFTAAPTQHTENRRHEIVFVDPATPDYDRLIADIRNRDGERHIEVALLERTSNGINQISKTLAGREDISAIHIISHGTDGSVQLGNTRLDFDSLLTSGAKIRGWGKALSADADLLIYGCDVAASEQGRSLIDALARLTGADVAASDDRTGHAWLGGDWDLEHRVGTIETALVVGADLQQSWGHALAVAVDSTSVGSIPPGSASDTFSHTTSGSDRLLLVGISFGQDNGETVTSVTHNGTNLTKLGSIDNSDNASARVEIWSLVAPTTGTHNVVVNLSGVSHIGAVIGAISFTGVEQSAPLGAFAGAQGNSNAPSVTVTSAANELVFGIAAYEDSNSADFTEGAGQTEQWNLFQAKANGTASTEAGAASVVSSWTIPSSFKWAAAGVSVKPVINSAPTISLPGGGLGYTENQAAQQIDATATVADTQGNWTGGTLTAQITANAEASDRIRILSLGNVTLVGLDVRVGGISIGTASAVSVTGGSALTVTFNASATNARVQELVRAIGYDSTSEAPGTTARTVTFTVADGAGLSSSATQTVNVAAVNDAPVLWQQHRAISLSSATPTADYPIQITLDATFDYANAQANGEDLRFYDAAGHALSYWIEDWTPGGNSTVWVKVTTAGTSSVDMYYGNASATAQSSATTTFAYYDDFESDTVGTVPAGWTPDPSIAGAPPTGPSVANVAGNNVFSDGQNAGAPVVSGNAAWSDVAVSQSFRTVSAGGGVNHAGLIARHTNLGNMVYGGIITPTTAEIWNRIGGTWTKIGGTWTIPAVNDGLWHTQELTVKGTTVELYIDGNLIGSATLMAGAPTAGKSGFWSQYASAEGYRDNHMVRDYSAGSITGNVGTAGFLLNTITEDQVNSAGQTVASFVGNAIQDVDAGALKGIAVTALSGNGTWQYSTDGTTWTDFGSVSATSALLLDSATQVRYLPDGLNGETASFSFRAWDQTSGTAGSTADTTASGGASAFSTATASAGITVNAVNDAPAGTNNTVGTDEDTAYVFSAADFGFSDPNDSPGNTLSAVTITTLPAAGSLTLSGVAVTAGQSISVANINAGNLVFTPAANASGAGYASFTFQVQDNGGTANGGVDLDQSPNTLTINVSALNDAPTNTMPAPQATIQNTALVFSSGNGNQISITDIDAGSNPVRVTLTGTSGTITLNSVAGLSFITGDGTADATMTFTGTAANIDAALNGLSFSPTAGFSGTASLAITTNDQGNTGSGGALSASNTVNISVNASGTPTATNDTYTVSEDGSLSVSNTWWNSNWQYRSQLSFNNASRAENLVDFQALVAIDTTAFGAAFYSQTQANGQDLRFVDANGTLLSHEIESWNPGGTSYVWVKVPQIDASSDVDAITMYWGNGSAPDAQNASAVWSNYAGVWHLNGDATDSSINNNDGTISGAVTGAGQFGQSLDFNGTTDYVSIANAPTLQLTSSLTMEGWVNLRSFGAGNDLDGIIRKGDANPNNYELTVQDQAAYFVLDGDDSGTAGPRGAASLAANTWYYVAGTWDGATQGLYVNGSLVDSGAYTGPIGVDTRALYIGGRTGNTDIVDGRVDEVRLSSASRTANWVNAQYASMTGSLISAGAVQARPATLGILANDTSPIGQPMTASLVSGPSNAASFTLNANGTFSYTPTANFNGTDTFTYRANDGSNSNVATVAIVVNSVNDAPAGTNNTVTTNEDTAYVFSAADFGFSDPNDSPANALSAVRIASLPGAGSLTLSGFAVTAGQSISVANINAGNLKFTPAADASGAGYASFTFQVQDDGGTTNGGVDLDPSANTLTINVTAVNDAPAGSNNTVSTNEDTAYTFTAADFGFSDPNDSPGNTLSAVTITTVPAAGSLTLSGVAVSAGQSILVTNINAGNLVFNPAANASGAGYASFTFQVQDNGGTANGGVDLDQSPNTLTINVSALNDAPVLAGANNLSAINEDPAANPGTLVSALIAGQVSDVDAGALSGIAVTAVDNTNGTWQYSTDGGGTWTAFGSPSGAIARLLAGDANSYVRFVPKANWNGTVAGGITFRAWDQSSGSAGSTADTTASGGTSAFSVATASASITVSAVNDAPAGTNNTVSANEDTAYTFTAADFGFSDPNDAPADGFVAIRIASLPGAGALTNNGVAVNVGELVSLADIVAGNLKFTPATDASGAGYASFAFQVQDSGGTASGGQDLDQTPNTITIDVTPINDAPTGTDTTVSTSEDTPYVFSAGDFGFGDLNDSPPDALLAVTITTLPGAGSLTLSGVAVSAGQSISVAGINAGNLVFTPAANASGAGYASFTFQVQDSGATAAGGVDLDQTPNTLTVDVIPVNDAPVGVDDARAVGEKSVLSVGAGAGVLANDSDVDSGALVVSEVEGNAADVGNLIVLPSGALLQLDADGGYTYDPNGAYDYLAGGQSATDTFNYTVSDGNGGSTIASVVITVNGVNDPPTGTDNNAVTTENTPLVLSVGDFGFSDPDVIDTLQAVRIVSLPGAGSLTLAGVAVTGGQLISAAAITAGDLVFTPAVGANGVGYASIDFLVNDGTTDAVAANTLTVDVTSVNDAPAGTDATVSTAEDTPYAFGAADFGFTDPNDGPANNFNRVLITTLPGSGSLTLNGVAVAAGDFVALAQLNAGQLIYTPATDVNGAGAASFTFQVEDDGGTAGGGVALDPTANTLTIDVIAVNDAPIVSAPASLSVTEDVASAITGISVADLDAAAGTLQLTFSVGSGILSASTGGGVTVAGSGSGALTLSGTQGALNAFIAGSNLTYTTAQDATVPVSLSVNASDLGNSGVGGALTSASALTLNVTPVNDAPVLGSNALTLTRGGAPVLGAAQLSASDVDNAAAGLIFSVTGVTHGQFEDVSNPGVAITSFTQAQIIGGQIRFVHDGSTSAPAYSVSVSDGGITVGPYVANGTLLLPPAAPVAVVPPPAPAPVIAPAPTAAAPAPAPAAPLASAPTRAVVQPAVLLPGAGIATPEVAATINLGMEIKGIQVQPPRLQPALNDYEPPSLVAMGLDLAPAQAELSFGPRTPPEWTAQFAFPDDGPADGEKDQIRILLEQTQLGGLALSVGVVWWASRVSGLLGSLLASAPAWRHIDPLPVLGRDKDEEKDKAWYEGNDLERDADELAMSLMLDNRERAADD
jgi:VCBS repeat-containing protein